MLPSVASLIRRISSVDALLRGPLGTPYKVFASRVAVDEGMRRMDDEEGVPAALSFLSLDWRGMVESLCRADAPKRTLLPFDEIPCSS